MSECQRRCSLGVAILQGRLERAGGKQAHTRVHTAMGHRNQLACAKAMGRDNSMAGWLVVNSAMCNMVTHVLTAT